MPHAMHGVSALPSLASACDILVAHSEGGGPGRHRPAGSCLEGSRPPRLSPGAHKGGSEAPRWMGPVSRAGSDVDEQEQSAESAPQLLRGALRARRVMLDRPSLRRGRTSRRCLTGSPGRGQRSRSRRRRRPRSAATSAGGACCCSRATARCGWRSTASASAESGSRNWGAFAAPTCPSRGAARAS
jgi:hypothetical protein